MKERIIGPDYKSLKNSFVSKDILDNEKFLRNIFSKSNDLRFEKLSYGKKNREILLVYIEDLVRLETIQNYVLTLRMTAFQNENNNLNSIDLKDSLFKIVGAEEANTFDALILKLLSGNTLLFIDEIEEALIIKTKEKRERAIGMAQSEQTIRGSRVAFTENVETNIALVRSQIKDPNLSIEKIKLGKRNQKDVAVMYIRGVINNNLPSAIIEKIQKVDVDGVVGTGQLEQYIVNNKWTVLPQTMITERLDRVVGNLLEGKAVIISDGTPFVSIIPTTFKMFLSSPDDYLYHPVVASVLLRLVRYMAFFIATSFAPLYLALTLYQTGMIPTPLALSITGSRLGLPFPMVVEVFIMEITLYILQEASVRLPKPMGTTVGVVGGLVIGQSVVSAGLVTPIIVIIIAGSAISSFALPSYPFSLGCTLIRIFLISLASTLGLYGVVLGWIIILIHTASLDNYGIRYLSDFSPYSTANYKDSIIKIPERYIYERPSNIDVEDNIKNNTDKVDDRTNDKW